MRFQEVYDGWQKDRLTQEEAALILGVSDRTFRRHPFRQLNVKQRIDILHTTV